jgi:hypothetical protein
MNSATQQCLNTILQQAACTCKRQGTALVFKLSVLLCHARQRGSAVPLQLYYLLQGVWVLTSPTPCKRLWGCIGASHSKFISCKWACAAPLQLHYLLQGGYSAAVPNNLVEAVQLQCSNACCSTARQCACAAPLAALPPAKCFRCCPQQPAGGFKVTMQERMLLCNVIVCMCCTTAASLPPAGCFTYCNANNLQEAVELQRAPSPHARTEE